MVKKIPFFLLIIINVFVANIAFAYSEDIEAIGQEIGGGGGRLDWPVPTPPAVMTSAFGYRVHPITGNVRHHGGVDLAGDFGDPIYAAGDGVVEDASIGYNGGYGNLVIIDHGNGLKTYYGHNTTVDVYPGQQVHAGQVIATMGSTGASTGPHCHFGTMVHGKFVDPGLFVSGMAQMETEQFGSRVDGGDPTAATDFDDSDVSLEVSADFAKPLKDVIDTFVDLLTKALGIIKNYIWQIFACLMAIDLAMSAMYKGLGAWSDNDEHTFTSWLFYKIITYGVLIFMLMNWGDFIGNLALESFPQIGALAVGESLDTAGQTVSDPTKIVQKGVEIIVPLINEALKVHGFLDLFTEGFTCLICAVLGIIFLILFMIIGIQVAKAYLFFYFTILFSFVNFMFAGLKQTRKWASNGINGIFASSLNLMFFVIFTVMLQVTMQNLVVGDLVETKTTVSEIGSTAKILSIDDCLARIRAVESYGGNYHCDNGQGYYGAYQIDYGNYNNWDSWCSAYEERGGILIHDGENYTRWNSYGDLDTAPEPTSTTYPWAPQNQDAVARFKIQEYYNEYGSWEAACRAWNQGPGGKENAAAYEYQAAILGHHGANKTSRVANISLLFQLLLLVLLFILIADHMEKLINKQFGGMGFKLTNEH